MRHKRMMAFLAAGATLACAPLSGSAWAAMPTDKPFSMRGVELGITLEAFKASAIPTDQGETQTQTWCSNQKLPPGIMLIQSVMNTGGGISCEWFSKNPASMLGVSNHWVSIGEGGGIPSFQFAESDGEWRLARISFYANAMYAAPIDDALTRGYGPGKSVVEPFQTRAGATYAVSNGMEAQYAYLEATDPACTPERRQQIADALSEYCTRDTLAMIRILETLLAPSDKFAWEPGDLTIS